MSKVLGIDASSGGAAGDMIVSALYGLQNGKEEILNNVERILSEVVEEPVSVEIVTTKRHDFVGYALENLTPQKKLGNDQLTTYFEHLMSFLQAKGKSILKDSWNLLLQSEKEIHETPTHNLHELGTFDTVFDLFSAAFLIDSLGIEKVQISPINTGSGIVKTAHGVIPVPAPATQKILESSGLETIADGAGEMLTPTGAAIIGAIALNFETANRVIWRKSAFGFGQKEFEGRINGVRLKVGESKQTVEKIIILETNVDDLSGELLGDAVTRLLDKGALDVTYIPIFTKKNRPGWQIQIISPTSMADDLATYLMRLTGTLGVRYREVPRHVGERRIETREIRIDDQTFTVRFKVGPFSEKIEFEDLNNLADQLGRTPLEILRSYRLPEEL